MLVVLAYVLFYFVIKTADGNQFISVSIASAVIALLVIFHSQTFFRIVAKSSPQKAGFISFALFVALSVFTCLDTASTGPHFFILLLIAVLASGAFGLLATVVTTAISALFLGSIVTNFISSDAYGSVLYLFPLTLFLGFISWLGWSKARTIDMADEAITPNKKIPKVQSSNLNAELLIASISDGVIVIDTDNAIQIFNEAAGTITGWDQNEVLQMDHRSIFMLVDKNGTAIPDSENPFSKTMSTGKSHEYKKGRLRTKNQKYLELDLVVSPVIDANGRIEAAIGVFRDVSKERNEQKQRAEFISTASHEMRTPVAAIEGYLALALNEKVAKIDSSARNYLEKAHISTQHLGKLFQDLLTAAKSEDGRLTNHPEVVEVGQYLDEIIEGVRFTAEKKGLIMEADFVGASATQDATAAGASVVRPVAYVHVDPERIREVITNLFDNAVKYTEEGKITIGMTTTEKDVYITVADTGPGIPKEDVGHLFQKFYRVDNTATRQIGGTGLGLFICRKIVELYSGKIWAESEVGKGSIFFVSLPRLTPQKAQELLKEQAANQSPLQAKIGTTPVVQMPAQSTITTSPVPAAMQQTTDTPQTKQTLDGR